MVFPQGWESWKAESGGKKEEVTGRHKDEEGPVAPWEGGVRQAGSRGGVLELQPGHGAILLPRPIFQGSPTTDMGHLSFTCWDPGAPHPLWPLAVCRGRAFLRPWLSLTDQLSVQWGGPWVLGALPLPKALPRGPPSSPGLRPGTRGSVSGEGSGHWAPDWWDLNGKSGTVQRTPVWLVTCVLLPKPS